MKIPVDVDEDELIDSLKREMSNSELLGFIETLDLKVADSEFTGKLIKNLLASLVGDLSEEEKVSLEHEIMELF